MNCRFRIDLPGLFGFPSSPSQDFCDGLPSREGPSPLPPLLPSYSFLSPFSFLSPSGPYALPPVAPLTIPAPLRPPERFTGLLHPRARPDQPYGVGLGVNLGRPSFSAADLMRIPDSMLRSALETTTPAPPPTSALDSGLSPDESPWVGVAIHLLGRLLASADIRIAGVPSNARADGLVARARPESEGGGEEFLPGGDPYRCRYTEFRENHFFTERIRDGEPYQPSCLDPEFSHRPECSPGERYICMAPETHATVRIQVREVEDTRESIVTHMAFSYDHHPHVLAERIPLLREIPGIESLPALLLRGFFGNDPREAHGRCRSTLDETVCDGRAGPTPLGSSVPPPARPYFLLQYSFEDPLPAAAPESVDRVRESTAPPYSGGGLAPSIPLLEFSFERGLERSPIQQLVTTVSRALNQDMLEGWLEDFGLNRREEARYRELGIPIGALPRSVMNFLRLVRPLFTGDTHDRLERQASTWNPNVELDESPLFLWSATQEVEINGLLRAGSLPLPGGYNLALFGRSDFRNALRAERAGLPNSTPSPEEEEQRLNRRDLEFQEAWAARHFPSTFNRIEIRANESELLASLVGAALPELNIPLSSTPRGETASLSLHRVLADRVSVELAPFSDLFDDHPIDPRPIRGISLENPYLRSMEIQYGTIAVTLRNVRAERMEYRLPSPREIREGHLTPEQYWTHGHWIVRGLRADSLRVGNPLYDLDIEMRNVNGEIDGRSALSAEASSIPFSITRLGAESIRTSMRGLGSVVAENTELNNLDLSLTPHGLNVSVGRIFSRASMEYQGVEASSDTHIRLAGETTISDLRLRMDYPEDGPLQGQVDFGISASLGAGTLDLGSTGSVELTRGSLRDGSFHSEFSIPSDDAGSRSYLNRLEGNLSVEVTRVDHFRSDFNIPGFSFDGSLENLILTGPTRITYGHDRWALERPEGSSTPLSLEALIRETRVHHDPRVSDARLRRIPHSEVAQTEATIHRARVRIDDFVHWSSLPTGSDGSERSLEVDFRGLRVTDISSSGELWAALPPWRYLRGLLAVGGARIPLQRGRPLRPLPPGGDCSALPGGLPEGIGVSENFIYLGAWRTAPGEGGRTESRLGDLRACLHSEPIDRYGSRPFVVLGIPELGIHRGRRPAVSSGDAPIHFDACVLDLARGGWVCITPAPRE